METNELYPIFLKLHNLNVLIVGGGNVGLEKLSFMLKSSPKANVEVVATEFIADLVDLAKQHSSVTLTKSKYKKQFLKKRHLVIACTDKLKVNEKIFKQARKRYLICNIADTPDFCDYYLGGIVTKGNVKIAISTNGKSPTTAKRLREFFEEVIPENINQMVQNLNDYRKTLKGNFEDKVNKMNEITSVLKNKE
ncbi:precorrin-2 dehydrogenase/sirohydrochlorin ferrochelatase family protein [Flavobacterium agrisoli]|uniref:precorrin-2 dehydrogenase n=1 Tax=Flavobacterium agrisoli TaxID=2793066 RepID=A0A934PN86_9FLAO|nr:bifunctional precorrin-2 dehydrogenase/sirohydrochlorin ferrochelatase [Flavobacterium agrisoli]MBK0370627.1 bifunctional precorrin-2 dehydrogenase/sirohydrochlorin ferrochelatase [Flavobacterium agrisoli]